VVSTITRFSSLRLRAEEVVEEGDEEEKLHGAEEAEETDEEENEDSENPEALEERDDGRESKSNSESVSGKETVYTEFVGGGIWKAVKGMDGKVPLVGVGDTMEILHFESMANISSASLSSWVDSSSCCASVGERVRGLRDK
jgi:hypothetical protein